MQRQPFPCQLPGCSALLRGGQGVRFAPRRCLIAVAILACGMLLSLSGRGPLLAAEDRPCDGPPVERVQQAVRTAIELVERSTTEYVERRQCFSCHHQAATVLMLSDARDRGWDVNLENFQQQIDHTLAHLRRGRESYAEGRGQGGHADTAGWALWTLDLGGAMEAELAETVVEYLVGWQSDRDHWHPPRDRPPSMGSRFTTTYLVLRALDTFGTAEQAERIAPRKEAALQWLVRSKPADTEDRVFRLRAMSYFDAEENVAEAAADDLLQQQRADGGWAQLDDRDSDAYATATALVALHQSGHLAADDPAYRKGVQFLLDARQPDGSWHVVTRAKPIQAYFESGFPHGPDQFLSITATSWATLALLPMAATAGE